MLTAQLVSRGVHTLSALLLKAPRCTSNLRPNLSLPRLQPRRPVLRLERPLLAHGSASQEEKRLPFQSMLAPPPHFLNRKKGSPRPTPSSFNLSLSLSPLQPAPSRVTAAHDMSTPASGRQCWAYLERQRVGRAGREGRRCWAEARVGQDLLGRIVEDLRWSRWSVGQLGQRDLPQRLETHQLALPKAGGTLSLKPPF